MSSLAVVIPLYNHAAYIGAALASVAAQTVPATRVIVIDDGSTDDSVAVAQRCLRPGWELVRQENKGAHATLNRGIEMAADCEWVGILNSDDVWEPERVARCLEVLGENSGADVVCTGLHLIDPSGKTLDAEAPKARRNRKIWQLVAQEKDLLLSLAVSNFAKTTSNIVARRSFCREHPFRSYRYVHDYYFLLQAALLGKIEVCPGDLLGYRVHETNTIKADGRRAVVTEAVQMHLDLLAEMAPLLEKSAALRRRNRLYFQRLLGNYTDFRGELLLQLIAQAAARQPELFRVAALGHFAEFEAKSEQLPGEKS